MHNAPDAATLRPVAAEPKPAERALGFWMCLALVVGNIIGSGVFLLPAALAPYGINAIFGWGVTIAGAICLAYVLAALARIIPGGPHAQVSAAFGPLTGFMVMWSFWISVWVANATIAVAAVSYLSMFAPSIANVTGLPALLAVGLIWLVTLVNAGGARAAGAVQVVTSLLKLTPLIAVIVIAAMLYAGDDMPRTALSTEVVAPGAMAGAAALTLWALLGFESATLSSDKVKDPERTVPRATMAGTAVAGLFYLLACSAVILLLPGEQAAASPAPFADAVAPYWGAGAAGLVALFAAISCLGALNGWTLVLGEVPLTLARSGVFPRWFGVTTAGGTPVRAQFAGSALASILVAMNYTRGMTELFTFMALLATVATLVLYLACALAALALLARGAMRSALLWVLATSGATYSIWAFYGAGVEATGWGAVLLATGLPVWWAMKVRSQPTPPLRSG